MNNFDPTPIPNHLARAIAKGRAESKRKRPVALPDVKELPRDIAKKISAISAQDWTKEDWMDLLMLQRIVRYNLAVRHGFYENDQNEMPKV